MQERSLVSADPCGVALRHTTKLPRSQGDDSHVVLWLLRPMTADVCYALYLRVTNGRLWAWSSIPYGVNLDS